MTDWITPSQFHESDGTEDWRVLAEGAHAFFRTGSYAAGTRLARAFGELEGVDDHVTAIDVRRDGVTVRLLTITDDNRSMSQGDVEVARRISAVARELGATADPTLVQDMLIVPGAPDIGAVVPFWRAALGYEPRSDSPDEDLVDPRSRGTSFWFEGMQEPRPDGGGAVHVGVFIPYELAEARVAAALAAGGHLVRDRGPMWWTLADAAGNEIDVATTKGRD